MTNIWVFRLVLALPALIIVTVIVPHFEAGLLLDRSFPATLYIETNSPLPPASYQDVANLLVQAPGADAQTSLLQAEAAIDAQESTEQITPKVEEALSRSPLSARGWVVLAALLTDHDPKRAANALTMAYDLAPAEYYLIFPRTLVAASLWDYLPDRIHAILLKDVGVLANDDERRDQLRVLLSKRGGPELLARSFSGKPDVLRALNRELALPSLHL
jgi:hypothetical protein